MMKNRQNNLTLILIILSLGLMLTGIFGAAWAGMEFIKPGDSSQIIPTLEISKNNLPDNHSNAPEPSTLALFGSAILSMIVSAFRKTYAFTKRCLDILGSILGLILTAPIIILTALAIKLTSPGPIFYSQIRVGRGGKLFPIYKFRSMRVDAEKNSGPVWAKTQDQRVTPIGRWIRRLRIDELPQFINVLKGDMSIIGPRPERPNFVDQFSQEISDYRRRLNVKPGITGLAQVHHHYDETLRDVRKKIKYDLLYIKKLCLWTDLSIVLRTFRVIITGAGAK